MAESTGPSREEYSEHRWTALAGMCVAAGMVWLSFADFGVAVPTISRELSASLPDLQWANNAFSLTTGALVLAAGRLGDVFGRKRMLELGLLAMGAVSLVAAFAPGVTGLIVGRAAMGVGAALILPATLALIPPMFPPEEQPRAFGAWMAVAWVGQAAGPAVGGVLTGVLGWRSTFWINAPLALVALWLVRRRAVESTDPNASRHIDLPGLFTSAAAAFCLLYGCTAGQEKGFDDPLIIGLLVGSVVLAGLFVLLEKRVADPLVDLRLFSSRPFCGALVANSVMNIVFAGVSFLLTLYLQEVRGYDAVTAGLLLLPSTVTILLFNPYGGRVSARRGARLPVVLGVLLLGVGTLVASIIGRHYNYAILAAGLLVLGAGLGLMSIPLSDTAVAGPPEELAGTASGMFKVTSMLGGAFGVAVTVAVQQAVETNQATDRAKAAGLSETDVQQLGNAVTDSKLADQILSSVDQATSEALTAAFQQVEAVGAGRAMALAGLLAVVAAFVLPLVWRRPAPADRA
ncbi:DHA2 family efflux MFS transporter permease subunit [Kitasatospora sp. NPDC088346]|uniref:DHA2 family efflux MFS transporter permease subunit n=1 Tax=Kitasatospora sp. NPDC088346 TaxID=3364073 RepID=UPI00381601BB